MLNYILPPIIIIVSVSVLIMFLFRKAEQLPQQELILSDQKKEFEKSGTKITTAIGQFMLKTLERMMHRAKLMSLKFHNFSNDWFQAIREKRQQSARKQMIDIEEQIAKGEEEIAFSRNSNLRTGELASGQKKVLRPMVRETVAMPQSQSRTREKNKLEEALIKRIAINPRDIEAYERLGDYYLENGNFQDSSECFRQVLKLSPTHQKARLRIRRLERMK